MSRRDEFALHDYLSENHPDFPLREAYGTRNALAHGYFKVDLGMVWKTVERDLPLLMTQVEDVLQRLDRV